MKKIMLVLFFFSLLGCSDFSPSTSNSSTPDAPQNSDPGDDTDTNLLGTMNNAQGVVLVQPISVKINSSETLAYVLDRGLQALVQVNLANGQRSVVSSRTVGSGVFFDSPKDFVISGDESQAWVTDSELDALIHVNLSTGNRTVVSNSITGSGQGLTQAQGIYLSPDESNAYVLTESLGSLLRVDLSTGNRTVLSSILVGSGTNLVLPVGLVVKADESEAYVLDQDLKAIFEVDLATGDRTVISSNSVGSGTGFSASFDEPRGLNFLIGETDLIFSNPRVFGSEDDSLIQVNISTGDRTVLSSSSVGTGVNMNGIDYFALSSDLSKVYVANSFLNGSLLEVDTANGNRTLLSESRLGSGVSLERFTNLALNNDASYLFAISGGSDALTRIDLSTGERAIVSGNSIGTGESIASPVGVVISSDEQNAYIMQESTEDMVLRVDLATGNRSIVSSNADAGLGPAFDRPEDIVINQNDTEVYILHEFSGRNVMRVSLSDGTREILSDNSSAGTGPAFGEMRDFTINSSGSFIYVVTSASPGHSIFEVDTLNGNRRLLFSSSVGVGPALGITISRDDTKLYIIEKEVFSLFAERNNVSVVEVDIATEARRVLSNADVGTGYEYLDNSIGIVASQNALYAIDPIVPAVTQTELSTGNRSFISK